MKPHILQLTTAQEGTIAEKQLLALSQGLAGNDFDVHICVLGQPGVIGSLMPDGMINRSFCARHSSAQQMPAPNENSVPVTSIPVRWKFDPKSFWELKRCVKWFRPDLIHAWSSRANCFALTAAKSLGVKHFITGYSCIDPFKSGARLALDRYIARQSMQLTANCSAIRDFYVQKGLPAEKFRVIPCGVEPPRPSTNMRGNYWPS